jgi:hypothetical protein
MNNLISVVLLGPPGELRRGVAQRLSRLDCAVREEHPANASSAMAGDLVVLDLRDGTDEAQGLVELLHADPRPLVILAPGPCERVRRLANRAVGTMLMSGAEDDSGYRVALSVGRGLAARRQRPPGRRSRPRQRATASGPTLGVASATLRV